MLELGILIPPSRFRCKLVYSKPRNQASQTKFGCNQFRLQYLVRRRYLLTAS